jgi:pimeloyl-ACP methyl ester carboxylesterase
VGLEAYLQGKRATAELLGQDPDSGAAREALEGIRASSIQGLQLFARHVAGPVPNLVDRLGEIDVPTLVLVGERDEAFLRASEVMTAKLPRARRAVLEGAGHVLHADRPEAFLREVEAFTAGL